MKPAIPMHIDIYKLDGPGSPRGIYPKAKRKPTPAGAPPLDSIPWGAELAEHERRREVFVAAPVPETLRGRR